MKTKSNTTGFAAADAKSDISCGLGLLGITSVISWFVVPSFWSLAVLPLAIAAILIYAVLCYKVFRFMGTLLWKHARKLQEEDLPQ